MTFRLSPQLDMASLSERYAAEGKLRIVGFLAQDGAERLMSHLSQRRDWKQLIGGETHVYELDRDTRAGFSSERQRALDVAVYSAARDGFQFRFETLRVPDDPVARAALSDPLGEFARWMASAEVLRFFRTLTGDETIVFADAQATGYFPGDFLTAHDDLVSGKYRRAAFVLGLTSAWRLEWGGLLTYHQPDGEFEGYMPGFNTLDLFRVPQMHSVSLVSPAAHAARLSVTGWLRAAGQEDQS